MERYTTKCHLVPQITFSSGILFFTVCATALFLSACSTAEERIAEEAVKRAGIHEDADYLQYVELREAGQLDEDGSYHFDQPEPTPVPSVPEGSVHVTFAVNSHLNIQYFYDAELTDPVDTTSCYIEPGTCIYAETPECASPLGSLYHFEGFRIYEYSADGNRGDALSWGSDDPRLVLQIPEDYAGSEIAVEPCGQYSKCSLSLEDYYIDNSGRTQNVSGAWFINGEELHSDHAEISPAAAYSVDYAYDTEKYEFVSSEPRCFSHENGMVQFETVQAGRQVESYSVRLQPLGREVPLKIALKESVKDVYFNISTSGSGEGDDLRYDAGEKTGIRPDWLGGTDRMVYDQKIRMGAEITLTAESGTLLNNYALRLDIVRTDTDGREYAEAAYITSLPGQQQLSVYNEGDNELSTVVYQEIRITVSKVEIVFHSPVSAANAVVELRLTDTASGAVVQANDAIENDRMVEVTITPDSGYYVTGSDVSNDVYRKTMRYSKWVSDAEKILEKHPIKKIRSVTLNTADDYGTCTYKLDGNTVSGTVEVREEQKLVLEYTVTDSNYQIAAGGGFFSRFQSKTEQKQEISISELQDGSTVRRSDYINVEKKGS